MSLGITMVAKAITDLTQESSHTDVHGAVSASTMNWRLALLDHYSQTTQKNAERKRMRGCPSSEVLYAISEATSMLDIAPT